MAVMRVCDRCGKSQFVPRIVSDEQWFTVTISELLRGGSHGCFDVCLSCKITLSGMFRPEPLTVEEEQPKEPDAN